jgi:hypothetical protein
MKNKIVHTILFIIIFSMLYQDFPLVNIFGELARTPIIFLIPFFIAYIFSQKNIKFSPNTVYLFILISILFITSTIYGCIIFFKTGSIEILGENIFFKALKMSMYPITALIFYIFIYSIIKNHKNIDLTIYSIFKKLQFFYFILLVVEGIYLKTQTAILPFLHSNPDKYYRIRLLTMEESWVGTVLILLSFFPIYLVQKLKKDKKERNRIYALSALILIFYLFISESKGFLFVMIISVLPMAIYKLIASNKIKQFKKILLPILSVSFFIAVISFVSIVKSELLTSVTFGTRFTSIISTLYIFITNPIGVGWTGYVYYYSNTINDIIHSGLMDQFNLLEIQDYINSSKNLSAKSYFLDGIIEGGLFFLIFFYLFFVRTYLQIKRNTENIWLKLISLYFILSGIVFITFHVKYEIWFIFAYIEANNALSQSNKNIASV